MSQVNIHRILVATLFALALLIAARAFFLVADNGIHSEKTMHVVDEAGVISPSDLPRFEKYMDLIMRESGVDIRFVFLHNTGETPINALARNLMDEYKIGAKTGRERGLLLLYDMQKQRMKVEVGYGLEGWFPDAFIHYLVEYHTRMFFSSSDTTLGLRLMLRLLQHRIREAVINNEFDPKVLDKIKSMPHLSGGGGVSKTVAIGDGESQSTKAGAVSRKEFPAGATPTETYLNYIDWLSHWPVNHDVDMFTSGSRKYLSSLPLSQAYAEFILMGEYGKSFEVVENDNLAILYFTGTPFVSPHFFRNEDNRWRMDLATEVHNTREHVGGEYTWAYRGRDDEYSNAFDHLLLTIKGYRRFRDGDNRPLTIAETRNQ